MVCLLTDDIIGQMRRDERIHFLAAGDVAPHQTHVQRLDVRRRLFGMLVDVRDVLRQSKRRKRPQSSKSKLSSQQRLEKCHAGMPMAARSAPRLSNVSRPLRYISAVRASVSVVKTHSLAQHS